MTIPENAARARVGTLPHPAPVRASGERSVSDFGTYSGNTSHAGRRMIAVTVALSESWHSPPIDWPETIAANLRLLYANTTVEVIDTWRVDQ